MINWIMRKFFKNDVKAKITPTSRSRSCWLAFKKALAFTLVISILNVNLTEAALVPGANGFGFPENGEFFYDSDVHGNVVGVYDATGKQVTNYAYEPYGDIDPVHSWGKDISPEKFEGHEFDYLSFNPTTLQHEKLIYFGVRYYDPKLGQFITPDPANQYFNPYIYAGASPESLNDPDGAFAFLLIGIIVASALISGYIGAASAMGDYNPAHWNKDPKKAVANFFIGLVAGAAGAAVGGVGGIIVGALTAGAQEALSAVINGESASAALEAFALGSIQGLDLTGLSSIIGSYAQDSAESDDYDYGSSFVRGTQIAIGNGTYASIENIRAGDIVSAYHEETASIHEAIVLAVTNRTADGVYLIYLPNELIKATAEHPFWREGEGWTKARHLTPSDWLRTSNSSEPLQIERISHLAHPQTVFNFEVENLHSYFVTEDDVLVHNARGPTGGGRGAPYKKGSHGERKKEGALRNKRANVAGSPDQWESHEFPAGDVMKEAGISTNGKDVRRGDTPAVLLKKNAHKKTLTYGVTVRSLVAGLKSLDRATRVETATKLARYELSRPRITEYVHAVGKHDWGKVILYDLMSIKRSVSGATWNKRAFKDEIKDALDAASGVTVRGERGKRVPLISGDKAKELKDWVATN
ncbi:MAG: hypothetical protein J0G29_06340 [Alphaproteobacteria bacterium]|nr:hypothetical protein [Alphaproteobacteria bacterium]OJV46377.1 MAG: hypothetical protein BGO28_03385 [Alphaproteobacteria bacterium 43-37]